MRSSIFSAVSMLAIAGGFAGALPAQASIAGNVVPYSTYERESDILANIIPHGQYTGVGAVFTLTQSTPVTGFGEFCSGSLIAADIVVTAAHCLGESNDKATQIRFYLPEYAASPERVRIDASGYQINPNYNGDALHGYDIAVIKLSHPVDTSLYDVYSLYTGGGELGQIGTRVGLGSTGNGDTGTAHGIDGYKRYGLQSYDITWDTALDAYNALYPSDGLYGHDGSGYDVFGAPVDSQLAYDFDDGTALHDVFGRYANYTGPNTLGVIDPNTGLIADSSSSPGDSGGPTFIDGKIAGITSFGISGNIYEPGPCAVPGSVDPSRSATNCTNSSFGDIGVDTRVASFQSYLTALLNGSIPILSVASQTPEPAAWMEMVFGFGLIGGIARSRRRTAPANG